MLIQHTWILHCYCQWKHSHLHRFRLQIKCLSAGDLQAVTALSWLLLQFISSVCWQGSERRKDTYSLHLKATNTSHHSKCGHFVMLVVPVCLRSLSPTRLTFLKWLQFLSIFISCKCITFQCQVTESSQITDDCYCHINICKHLGLFHTGMISKSNNITSF